MDVFVDGFVGLFSHARVRGAVVWVDELPIKKERKREREKERKNEKKVERKMAGVNAMESKRSGDSRTPIFTYLSCIYTQLCIWPL